MTPLFAEFTLDHAFVAIASFVGAMVPLWRLTVSRARRETKEADRQAAHAERDAQVAGMREMLDAYRAEANTLRERVARLELECRQQEERMRAELHELHDYVLCIKREINATHPDLKLTTLDEFRARHRYLIARAPPAARRPRCLTTFPANPPTLTVRTSTGATR